MACEKELSTLTEINGCPSEEEYFLVGGAYGGEGEGKYGIRKTNKLRECFNNVIPITSADFEADGQTYLNDKLTGFQSIIYLNNINRYILQSDGEFDYVYDDSGENIIGVKIFVGEFDANTDAKYLVLTLIPLNSLTIIGMPVISGETDSEVTADAIIYFGGGSEVSERGFVWSETPMPTIDDNKLDFGSGIGAISGVITGLNASTNYYIRAYAINDMGVGYGNQNIFTTIA